MSLLPAANLPLNQEANRMRLRRKWKQYGFVLALIAWPVCHFLLFWLYVNLESFMLIFKTFRPLEGTYVWAGLGGVKQMFDDMVLGQNPGMNRAMWNSVFSIIPGLFIILPLAFITAFAFYKHVPGEKLFRVMFYLPSMISVVVLTMCYKYMFDPEFGPITVIFEKWLGIEGLQWLTPSTDNKLVWPLIYLFCVWAGLGSNVILMGGAMQRIPKEITESGKLDGIEFWRESVSIVLPLIMPTVTNFIVLSLMGMFGFMLQPMLLTNIGGGADGMTKTVAMYVFANVNSGLESNAKNASTAGILFSLMFGPFVILTKLVLDKVTPKVEF